MKGGKAPTAAQKIFWSRLCDLGCTLLGPNMPAEIHHPVGSTYRHQGEHIGNWFVLALNDGPHRNWPNANFSTKMHQMHRYCFERWPEDGLEDMTFLELQVWLYNKQLRKYEYTWNQAPPVPEEIRAVINTLKSRGQGRC